MLRNLFSLLCLWLLSLGTHSFASLPGNESAIGQRTTIALSDTERQWVMEHPVIRLGVDPAWPPFDFIDRQGVHRGMAADFLQLLVQRLGISVEMIPDIGWNQALERARDRSLDLVSLSHGTPERLEFMIYTDVVTSVPWSIVTQKDYKEIDGLNDLAGLEVALVKGYAIEELIRTDYPDIKIRSVASSLDGLRAVASGQVKAMVESLAVASYLISENNLVNLRIAADSGLDVMELGFGVRSDWPQLVELLNRAIRSLSRDEVRAIYTRWAPLAAPAADDGTSTSLWWFVAAGLIVLVLLIPVLLQRLSSHQHPTWFSSAAVRRIGAVAVALFLGVVMLLAWYSLERVNTRLRVNIGNQLSIINNSVHQSLRTWFDSRQGRVSSLAREPKVVEAAVALLAAPRNPQSLITDPAMTRLRTLLQPHLDSMNARGIFIIAPDRFSIASMRDANLGTRNLIAQQRSKLMDRAFAGETVFIPPIVSDVPLRDQHGQMVQHAPTMFFATPLRDANGGVVAVFTVRFEPAFELTRITETGRPGESGETYAIDENGRLLTVSRFEESLIDAGIVTATGTGDTSLQGLRIADPGGNLLSGYVPGSGRSEWPLTLMASEATHGHSGRDVAGYRDYRGVSVIGAWLWSKELGIGLATEIDEDEALAPYLTLRNLVIGALGVTALLALALTGLSVWLGDRAKARLERLVEERTEELRKVVQAVEQSPLCVVITDMAGNIEHVNSTFTKVTGYEAHEVIGKNPRILKGGETPPEKYDSLWETILAGKVWHSEIRNRRKNGEHYWGAISIAPVKNDAGEVTHFVAMTADITEAKKVETERRLAEDELARQRILLASTIDTIPDIIFLKDAEGRYLQCNPSFAEFIGRNREDIIGRTDYDLFDAGLADEFREHDQRVVDAGTRRTKEEWVTYPDGSKRLLETTKVPYQDSAGKIGGVLGISRDITERNLAAEALAEAEERQRLVLDSAGEGIFGLDIEGQVTFCNRAAADMLGYKADELLGTSMHDTVHYAHGDGAAYNEEACPMRAAFHDGMTHHIDDEVLWRKEGTAFPVEYSATPISHAGKVVGAVVVFHDITERKRSEDILRTAKLAAEAANQAKSAFLANMSHELRTPMNAILGYSEMLIEEAEDLDQQDFIPDLQKINKAGTHLLALINDVLDLAKVESGKMEAFAEDIDIDNLIDEVSGTAHPLMEKNNNTLSIVRGNELGSAHQDLTKLRQILFNLLSNAAKFTHDGTISLHVNRSRQADADWLTFAVSDTGIGIAADKIDYVFEEFTQADDSTTRDYGGTGLGLAISRRFCKLLGGDLGAASELGKGSTFTIHIPAILPEGQVLHPSADTATTPDMAETELESLREAGPGTTVLVIDDDTEACEIIERYLTKDGYTVVTAASGEQGLRLAHELQPAVITLDVMMPGMDGWSVLRMLKADPKLHNIPVIMLSMIDDRTRGYSLGAVDYLTKPVDREQLHKALSRYYCTEDVCSVLLIEDAPETREVMARTLKKAGWSVSEAGNGREALDIMGISQPHLILLDLMMPVMDGFDFLTAMRAQPEWRHIPVIVITAKDLTKADRDRLAGRVEAVLEKSAYTREQLLERVSEAVAVYNSNT